MYPWPKIQLKRVNHKLSWRMIVAPSTGRFREASSGPERSLFQYGLVEKEKTTFMDSRKLLLIGEKFKETKHDRFGKRPAATDTEEIYDRLREVDVNALGRSIGLFFFSFYDRLNNFRFAFFALNVASQAFTRICFDLLGKINQVLRCSLSGELACGPMIEFLYAAAGGWTEKAARCPARASCAGSKVRAENFAWARNSSWYGMAKNAQKSQTTTGEHGLLCPAKLQPINKV